VIRHSATRQNSALGNGQTTGNVAERGLEPGQPRCALIQAVFQGWVQRLPKRVQNPFGQLQAKGDTFEVLALSQPFTEPGRQHQVFALLRQPLRRQVDHLRTKALEIATSLHACKRLQATVDRLFEREAPSFASLADMLSRASQLAEKLLKDRGVELHPTLLEEQEPEAIAANAANAQSAGEQMDTRPPATAPAAMRTTPLTRDEAFTMLAGIAQYFKQSEPQSPVPYLIERAIKWGNMPLEGWLSDVIKDNNVVDNIRDVLGTR